MNKAQENRAYTLEDQLGEDFYLLSFTGSEGISKLFSYQLHLASRRDDMQHKPEEILNKEAKLRFYVGDSDTRYVKGYINRFSSDYQPGVLAGFHAELVPWLWFLTQTSDCRIFEDKSIPDIIEDVFNSDPIKDIAKFERKLENNYPKLEYCVQYRETDFNFVSRLMEEAGIFYFFDFSGDGSNSNKLIMADNAQAYFDSIEKHPIQRTTSAGTHNVGPEILDWEHRYEFVAGKWTHSDHTFKEPYENFEKNSETKISNKLASDFKKYEMYDYPGNFVDSKSSSNGSTQSTDLSKVRIGEEEHPFDRVTGTSDCVSFAAGSKFTLNSKRVPADDSKTFAIISVQHSGSNPNYATGPAAGGKYTNSFTCVPESYVFNPPRTTPKPTVGGIQTATVIGPEGEEIHTDEHARIKCLFHWARPENSDRKKPSTQTSCWIRVAQASAGKKWGFLSIPRVGQEVVVDFLDGNPDRPLVVGSVYNSTQETAYKLPDDMAKTYFKTNSTPGGEGFNELFFDDKAEKERIFLHAQKDLDVRVLNDSRNRTFGNRSQIIGYEDKEGKRGGWQRELIYQDKEINVKRHQIEHIEGNHQMMVGHGDESTGGNIALVVEKSVGILIGSEGLEMTCEGDSKQHTEGDHELLVDGDIMQKSKNLHFTVDSSFHTSSNEISTSASTGIDIEAGTTFNQTADQTINIKGGMHVNIQAGASLSLSVGGNFISINPGGIFIQGTLVNINSGGSSTPAQSASTTTPTAPTGPEETVTKAAPTEPAMAHDEKTGFKSLPE